MRERTSRSTIATLILALALAACATAASASVEAVPVGIKFSHTAPGASSVTLAGTFNGWDAERNPMTDDGRGVWTVVMALKPGQYEYKFVVDGTWTADPGNPQTVADPYGGANSVVVVDDEGGLVPFEQATAEAGPNTALNARITLTGRYLGRYVARKNYDGDPRFRMRRPEQNVDLNFHTAVSDVVDAYTRLRVDNTKSINMNDISAELDEAALDVHPGPFHVVGYWDMEMLQLGDPLSSGGDVDLPGTIMDDHLVFGKGTAGTTISGTPFGLDFRGFFADVHEADTYNDDEIFDNTGRDLFGARLSHEVGGFTVGLPFYMERHLGWYDLGDRVSAPEGTGMAALDAHLARTGDTSTWYELDDLDLRAGLDLSRPVLGGKGLLQLEWLYNQRDQAFVTGNEASDNNTNGEVDVPLLDRSRRIYHGSFDYSFREGRSLNLEHTTVSGSGAEADENLLEFFYLHQDEADKRIYVSIGGAPPELTTHYSELTLREGGVDRSHTLWVQRREDLADYAPAGTVNPLDGAGTARALVWTFSASNAYGSVDGRWGRFELENAWTDHDDGLRGYEGRSLETILRWERKVGRRLYALADLRNIDFDLDRTVSPGATESWDEGFWAPWLGLRYLPSPKLEIVFAWGVDPLDFDVDYQGRRIGRWLERRRWLDDNPGASELDAERALGDARQIGLRAHFLF